MPAIVSLYEFLLGFLIYWDFICLCGAFTVHVCVHLRPIESNRISHLPLFIMRIQEECNCIPERIFKCALHISIHEAHTLKVVDQH